LEEVAMTEARGTGEAGELAMAQHRAEEPLAEGPKPIAVQISTDDIQALFAAHTTPNSFMQLILAKLKDAGAPIEGVLHLKLAHGKVFKMKDSIFEEQAAFTYLWIPEAYLAMMSAELKAGQA
jgi:hypothetical protein